MNDLIFMISQPALSAMLVILGIALVPLFLNYISMIRVNLNLLKP